MNFIDRIEESRILHGIYESNNISKALILGASGIGKSALIQTTFPIESSIYICDTNECYFRNVLLKFVDIGFHKYLLGSETCNYKDVFLSKFKTSLLQGESIVNFICENIFLDKTEEIIIEELMAEFLISKSNINCIIFDNCQNCKRIDFERVLKLVNFICLKKSRKFSIIFSLSSSKNFIYNNLISICDTIISLKGFDKIYIETLLKEFFKNQNLKCDKLAEFLHSEYAGNPGTILTLLKLKFNSDDKTILDYLDIMDRLLNPEFYCLDPTEKRIMLFLSVMPFDVTKKRLIQFLMSDPEFSNIDDANTCDKKINNLTSNNFITRNGNILSVSHVIKDLYWEHAKKEIYLVYLIYNYHKNFKGNLSDRENSDCLYFIIKSAVIHIEESMHKEFFRCTLNAAISFAKNELWNDSVEYFKRLLEYQCFFDETSLTLFIKSFYYNADYLDIYSFITSLNDQDFNSFDYWYWKGNLLYMLNDKLAIECLDKAIISASTPNEKIYAQIVRKGAISELPEYCSGTLSYYKGLLEEYKNKEYPALSTLYRNSLVLGGYATIDQCDEGLKIAKKYGQYEEIIKLNHNKHFELFRMSLYSDCSKAFEESANFFQKKSNRLYESAYGYNNLALLSLVNKQYENAYLYALSAVTYAGTPYSVITTHVNANLIGSFFFPPNYDLENNVVKINDLIEKYGINDNRIYRKTYFSIAIAYINANKINKAIEYVRKSEPHLQEGKHINRYCNLCKRLNVTPIIQPIDSITTDDPYYNFYANPEYELWLLAYGHI